jgi:drug/metabolite transporter (DMT)-like permease
MTRERALKTVLVIFGMLFVAAIYPLVQMREEPTLQMMLSVYVTLGVFLLLASRNPSAYRSLIAFGAWSSLAHAATMAVQSVGNGAERTHLLVGTFLFAVIGLALILLAPAKVKMTAS